jgi:hypothetical protein
MYEHRQKLKAHKSPAQMAYKLGPNSLYGKAAQKVGWDKKTGAPPRAHSLPIAGWITSACRAMLQRAMIRVEPRNLIAVETDGFFTREPVRLPLGEELGQWEATTYDELVYVQSGVYMARQGDEWSVKSRGATSLDVDEVLSWLASLTPDKPWEEEHLTVGQSEQFVTVGAAIARATTERGVNPYKLNQLHCRWEPSERRVSIGEEGKRLHIPRMCVACENGHSAAEAPHELIARSPPDAMKHKPSTAYHLPWEDGEESEVERLNRESDEHIGEHEA